MEPSVLIIDDQKSIHESISKALIREGYNLHFAFNGKEGLELIKSVKPQTIILDIKMPVMDGITFLETLKPKITDPFSIIVLTDYGSTETIKKCYQMGIKFFLSKPINIYELRGLIRSQIAMEKNKYELNIYREHLENMVKERTKSLEDIIKLMRKR